MRFLSLFALSGCALFDAAGTAKGGNPGGDGPYELRNIPGSSQMPRLALAAELDGQPGLDVVVFDQSASILVCLNTFGDGTSFACEPTGFAGGYSGIAVDDLDGDGRTEVIAYGVAKLHVLVPENDPVTFRMVDLSSKIPPSETRCRCRPSARSCRATPRGRWSSPTPNYSSSSAIPWTPRWRWVSRTRSPTWGPRSCRSQQPT